MAGVKIVYIGECLYGGNVMELLRAQMNGLRPQQLIFFQNMC